MKNILRPKQAAKQLSISLSTFWRLQKNDGFPKKIQISSKAVGFYEEDIATWLEKKILARDSDAELIKGTH